MEDESDSAHRWVGVGGSTDVQSRRAGAQATRQALVGADPQLLVVFCSAGLDPQQVLAGIAATAPGVPLIGCSSSTVIGPDGVSGDAVVVTALGGPGFSVATGVGHGAGSRQRQAGVEVAGCVAAVDDRPQHVLVLLTDGVALGQEQVLAGAYSVVGASMPLVGGLSSPADRLTRHTFSLYGGQVLTDAVVGAVIASDGPFGVGISHGWRKVGGPMLVTKAVDGSVRTLDDQPALAAYLRRLDAPDETYRDPIAFETFARTRPIGVRRRYGEEVRNVSSRARFAQGWLNSSGDIPEGSLVWPMVGDHGSVLAAAGQACGDAVAGLGGRPPLGLLAFDCESRAEVLGLDGMREEVAGMTQHAGTAPVAGCYTWGEIARTRGINGYHNQTLAVLAMG